MLQALVGIGNALVAGASALGSFGFWALKTFGTNQPEEVTEEEFLKALQKNQKLLILVMAISMSAVLLTSYIYEV